MIGFNLISGRFSILCPTGYGLAKWPKFYVALGPGPDNKNLKICLCLK